MAETTAPRYLDPEALSRLAGLNLRARAVVQGTLAGLHRSPHRGNSIEFTEHKEYTPGDEIRHIDWKVFGKSDRFYVKQYEDEVNLQAYLLLDASGSMGFGSGPLHKYDYGAILTAALAYLLVRQGDAAGLTAFAGGIEAEVPPRAKRTHLKDLVASLEGVQPAGPTELPGALRRLAERLRRRGMVVVLSDLFDVPDASFKLLRQLRTRGHDVLVLHLLDRAELTFPYQDPTLFLSLEDDRRIQVDPRGLREAYLAEFSTFLRETRQRLAEANIDYLEVATDSAPDRILRHLVARREGRR